MPAIFISYRRDDSKGFAGALARDLGQRFGAEEVFLDVDDMVGGTDFPTTLRNAVTSCAALLVLIGPQWLEARRPDGRRRLDEPGDFVRQEIELGLTCGVRVVPVLLDGAPMPSASDLPVSLEPLSRCHALPLSNTHWAQDVATVSDHVRRAIYERGVALAAGSRVAADFIATPPMTRRVKWLVGLAGGAGLLFGAIGLLLALQELRLGARAVAADGEVVALRLAGDGYRPEVRFVDPEGREQRFLGGVESDPPSYAVGDRVRVLVDPQAAGPGRDSMRIDSFVERWLLPGIFGGFGLLGLAIGGAPLALRARRLRRQRWLIQHGRPVVTTFHAVEQIASVTLQGRHPYVVVTEWRNPVSGETVHFRSDWVWDDPTEQARQRMITVVVDPDRLSRYAMDLSFLGTGPRPAPAR